MATEKKNGKPEAAGPLKIKVAGVERVFDIDNPVLPDWIDKKTVASGGFPYDKKLDGEKRDALRKAHFTGNVAAMVALIEAM